VLLWSAPAVVFLGFMVPLPFRVEGMLSYPLQRIATHASCFALQCLGLPALAEGNTILLGNNHLEVEQACSGLRIFMATIALAFVCVVLVRRSWWESAAPGLGNPIALLANSLRVWRPAACLSIFRLRLHAGRS
jgi:exosortase